MKSLVKDHTQKLSKKRKPNETMRIGALAKLLNLKQFVIRYWEREFNIKPKRSTGRQRYYTKKDIEKLATIKTLLHEKKFTISGAKQYLQGQTNAPKNLLDPHETIIGARKSSISDASSPTEETTQQHQITSQKIYTLKKQLEKLSTLL